jgi:predicted 2-oxoglutarate/Fe(II)-dependent dioxygenase YbiX
VVKYNKEEIMTLDKKEKSPWQIFKESGGVNSPERQKALVSTNFVHEDININFTKEEIVPGVWIYKNVFKNVDKLVDDINENFGTSWVDGQVYSGDENTEINKKARDCSVLVLSEQIENITQGQSSVYHLVKTSMTACMEDYLSMFAINLPELLPDSWQVLKYGHGQHFEGHADDGFRFPRTVSITAYLNDSYTGGELEYKHFGLKFKPDRGDVLIFPSNYVYNHQVLPVDTGLRYALVNWFRWNTMKVDMLA